MLLLTGATGLVGSAVLRRLTAGGEPVRCLVRDPRRLGAERVRVQLAIGDLSDPASWRHALRGVRTVVHLAATERDQPRATIEEIDGLAAARLLRAAERERGGAIRVDQRRSAPRRTTARACTARRRSLSGPWRRRACTRPPSPARWSTRPATAACTAPRAARAAARGAAAGRRQRAHAADLGRRRRRLRHARARDRRRGRRSLRAGRPRGPDPPRHRPDRPAGGGAPSPAAPGPAGHRPPAAARARGARRPDRVRHLGRGAAAHRPDARSDGNGRRRAARRGPAPDGRRARRWLRDPGSAAGGRGPPPSAPRPAAACPRRAAWPRCGPRSAGRRRRTPAAC